MNQMQQYTDDITSWSFHGVSEWVLEPVEHHRLSQQMEATLLTTKSSNTELALVWWITFFLTSAHHLHAIIKNTVSQKYSCSTDVLTHTHTLLDLTTWMRFINETDSARAWINLGLFSRLLAHSDYLRLPLNGMLCSSRVCEWGLWMGRNSQDAFSRFRFAVKVLNWTFTAGEKYWM